MKLSYDLSCGGGALPAGVSIDYSCLAELAGTLLARIDPARYNDLENIGVALSFVGDDDMRELNARYRSIDEPTDVLSFPLWEESGVFSPPSGWDVLPLGDVVVSPDFVRRSASLNDVDCVGELVLVIVHGTLHLVGYGHDTDEKQSEMWKVQELIRDEYMTRSNSTDPTERSEED